MTSPDAPAPAGAPPEPAPEPALQPDPASAPYPVVPITPDPTLLQIIERNDKPDLTKEFRAQ
jgi:hypothetical protein